MPGPCPSFTLPRALTRRATTRAATPVTSVPVPPEGHAGISPERLPGGVGRVTGPPLLPKADKVPRTKRFTRRTVVASGHAGEMCNTARRLFRGRRGRVVVSVVSFFVTNDYACARTHAHSHSHTLTRAQLRGGSRPGGTATC